MGFAKGSTHPTGYYLLADPAWGQPEDIVGPQLAEEESKARQQTPKEGKPMPAQGRAAAAAHVPPDFAGETGMLRSNLDSLLHADERNRSLAPPAILSESLRVPA
jgi:hypothetical protein